ncbi:FAD-binding oxidoreductase [Serratia grimesii]|uniref:FAD-binding oxidoreductase n=1 Tax=Serratia grimesii TaxID=82995 RepID=UPI0009EDC598|nr:FAD-binding oxidoreductase [Serratia grimesii]CAI1136109.1 6-hydroxy-D-nicotine oxidase [Serratia grimesii]CAI2520541.1 6-hydroxy-D-nicotine oxidase [Serratia grimesii]SUI37059.1 6-hydroxy-D-nicotine oxidase [Serratia grimesii]
MKDNAYCADAYRCFVHHLQGRIRSRYHPEYSGWLRQSTWNRREFGRMPEMIVRAETVADVVETVRFAERHRHPISVRAGGYSYGGGLLRDNSILLDISALRELEIEPGNAMAKVGPGLTNRELSAALKKQGLAFPTGHDGNTAIGEFLLGGGMGINSAAWGGMSVFNVEAVDLVTADGQLRHASRSEYPELFWAVQGAGPHAFFVVVCFYIKCYSLPRSITNCMYQLPFNTLELLLEIIKGKDWDTRLQIAIVLSRPEKNQPKTLILNTLAFADSEEESAALQAGLIQNIPVNLITLLAKTTCKGFDDIHQQYASMQTGRRFRSDNIMTDQIQLAAAVLDVFLPEQPAQDGITRLVWRGKQTFPDAAYAVKGQFLVSTYLQWDDAKDDDANHRWLVHLYDRLAALSCGYYINEFDLEARSGNVERCYTSEGWQRLNTLRQHYDPAGIFVDVRRA